MLKKELQIELQEIETAIESLETELKATEASTNAEYAAELNQTVSLLSSKRDEIVALLKQD